MKTVAQLKAEVRKLIWADMEPENLIEQHDEHFQEALAHLAQNVPCEREGNVDITDFCKTNSKCGMTIVPEPNGVVRRVFTLVKEPNEDWCDAIFYREVDWPLPEYFGKMAMSRMRTLPSFPKSLDLGFHPADVSQESPCGRARQGIWAKHRGNIFIAPWIQSVERVCVEWDGVKSRWEDADPVNDSLLYRKTVMLYWHYLHEYFFGERKDAMGIHDVSVQSGRGTFDRALADLIYACEERRKVRESIPDPYWHRRCLLTPVIEQEGKPLTPAGPTVLAHIGNFVDGDGSAVAALVDNYAPTAVLAAGVNVAAQLGIEYDQLVGHNYSNYLAPYYGNFGAGAEKNKFWPAIGDLDWTDALEGFHAAFATPKNENYYDVCLGPVHLFVLDLNTNEPDGITSDSAQGQWLMAKMALSTAPWKVVMASKLPDPLWDFKSWGANLVLTGLPYYERRVLGTMIMVNNGAGGGPQSVLAEPPPAGTAYRSSGQHGAGFIVATRCSLTYSFVNVSGTVLDTVGLHKGPDCIDPADSTVVISGAATAAATVCGKQVYQNAGDPNGVVTPATALKSFCIDTVNSLIWVKDDGVISPYGWS